MIIIVFLTATHSHSILRPGASHWCYRVRLIRVLADSQPSNFAKLPHYDRCFSNTGIGLSERRDLVMVKDDS